MIENQAAIQICREMRVSLRSGGVVIVRETPDRQTLRLITPGSTTDLTSAEASALASMTYRLDVERLPAEPVEQGEVSEALTQAADRLLMLEAVALIQGRTLAVRDDESMVCDLCGGESAPPDCNPEDVDLINVAGSIIHLDGCRGERICQALRGARNSSSIALRDMGGFDPAREEGSL